MSDFIVITNGYPSEKKLYNNAFVHRRVINYIDRGYKGFVIVIRPEHKTLKKYEYEGVIVYEGNSSNVQELLKENTKAKILIHFVDENMINAVTEVSEDYEIIIWIHGTEALGWKRRLFNLRFNIKSILSFSKYIYCNTRQMKFMRKLILDNKLNIKYIFVSEWMKDILEEDTDTKIKESSYEIIPNVIDEKIFYHHEKSNEKRLKVLSIRPYSSRKYANDISVKAVLKLSEKDYFDKLNFSFYGDGYLFDKTLEPLRRFENVSINKTFLSQKEIAKLHGEHGVVLCPTRQDAQGVSMCEAVASGLVPIVSNNTAIPEFINSDFGFLCNDVDDFVESIQKLYDDSDMFKKMSEKGSEYMIDKCGASNIEKEIDIIDFSNLKGE